MPGRRRGRLEDITAYEFKLRLKETYGSYYMYVSDEEDEHGNNVINGVYVLKSYLGEAPPEGLVVSFQRLR